MTAQPILPGIVKAEPPRHDLPWVERLQVEARRLAEQTAANDPKRYETADRVLKMTTEAP